MSRVKIAFLPVSAAVIIALSYLVYSAQNTHAVVLANRPSVDITISFWQNRIQQNPRGYIEYSYLGDAYTRKARETGDVGYYQRAEEVLRKGLTLNPKYAQTSALLAGVLFAMHDFQGALNIAKPLAGSSDALQALAVLGDVQLALGNYSEVDAAYQKLSEVAAGPSAYSRLSVLADLHGDPDMALGLMQKASNLALQNSDYPESLAWYEYQVGELYYKTGRLKQARAHYQKSLEYFNPYYLVLGGLGKVAAAQGDYPAAISYYQKAVEIIPQPDLLAALGDLYTLTGQPDKARLQYETVDYIGKLARINQQIYNRQLANFYSDHDLHLEEALKLAMGELEFRKDVFGYDASAWASYKNGIYDQAQTLMDQAMRLGTRDPKLYYHAGMIAQANGRKDKARRYLTEALSINLHFDLLQARIARKTLEQLNHER